MPIRRAVAALACTVLAGCGAAPGAGPGPSPSTVDSPGTAIDQRVPPAGSLVVSMRDNRTNQAYGPVTIVDPAQVDAVAARVDRYPVDRSGPRPCPLPAQRFDLSFRAAGGTVVAGATTSGCDDVYLTVGGTSTPLVGADDLIRFTRDTLHLTWPAP